VSAEATPETAVTPQAPPPGRGSATVRVVVLP